LEVLDLAARIAAGTLSLTLALLLLRDLGRTLMAALGALFSFGTVTYLGCSSAGFAAWPAIVRWPALFGCLGNPFFFWLFARCLFEDGMRLRMVDAAIFVGLMGAGLTRAAGVFDADGVVCALIDIFLKSAALGFVLHILFVALRDRGGDLLERRRHFRLVFAALVGAYIGMVTIAEIAYSSGDVPAHVRTGNPVAILLLTFCFVFYLTTLRRGVLLPAVGDARTSGRWMSGGPAAEIGSQAESPGMEERLDTALLEQVRLAMEARQLWRQEGLTIGQLAREVAAPEYRLRRVVNQALGHRNFAAFLNAYRLPAAMRLLADPTKARLPVLSVALEVGYGSIGPFNRAFKEATGQTPTEYRRARLAGAEE